MWLKWQTAGEKEPINEYQHNALVTKQRYKQTAAQGILKSTSKQNH
jgi:hypothetical protein